LLRTSTLLAAAALDAAPPMWKGTHGELRAGFADRLRGDDAHRLADRDRPTARQIPVP